MEHMEFFSYVIIFFAYACGGFMDSIVGGGGIITISSAFVAIPNASYATVIGTNKWGVAPGSLYTSMKFLRNYFPKAEIVMAVVAVCFTGGVFGALLATHSDKETLIPIAIVFMILMVLYSYFKKGFGIYADYEEDMSKRALVFALISMFGASIYDGVIGAGSGSIMSFAVIRFLKLNFIKSAAFARTGNAAALLGAMFLFTKDATIIWSLIPIMVCGNIIGAVIGVKVAISKGDAFVRVLFIVISSVLIVKMINDYYYEFVAVAS